MVSSSSFKILFLKFKNLKIKKMILMVLIFPYYYNKEILTPLESFSQIWGKGHQNYLFFFFLK
jgi:hypothetical protein